MDSTTAAESPFSSPEGSLRIERFAKRFLRAARKLPVAKRARNLSRLPGIHRIRGIKKVKALIFYVNHT